MNHKLIKKNCNVLQAESPLIRAWDIKEMTVVDETFFGLEVLEEYKKLLGGITFDELMGERNDINIVNLVSPPATNEVIGKGNFNVNAYF